MNRPKIQRPASALSGMRQPAAISRPSSRASSTIIASDDKPATKRPATTMAKTMEATAAPSASISSSETNIQVVVRCRDRNDRERAENSGVIVSTKVEPYGRAITVQTSPLTELNNKTYTFDRVYGAEATQSMVFDDTVEPIVQEMLGGYNCTIFAYGQTGTGKTYTMSGDMSDYYGKVTDAAGIIPRALYRIFQMLDLWGDEYSVKCSFIELYNEELRDLLAIQEDQKVKIFDDTSKKGGVLINGMEELAVTSAMHGVKILQDGSRKREVAATKCNEVSSRSHSVFTITVHIKQTSTEGEDMLRIGKLNLVDLAGSENVGRSGAENKRAREAGMINQSLLTLGRVINALVDRSQHIPYRESKLTRLLQDSLGGRTKTCIIATLSPAKINMDETVSTLEYANRAKSIKNKPQVNQMMTKKALIKDYILEIERLKGDLNSTRQKNGVYMTEESHQELVNQNESNKLLTEEQQRKLDALSEQLRGAKESFEETMSTLTETRRELEKTSKSLAATKGQLDETQKSLATTQGELELETERRKAHQTTEIQLDAVAKTLKATLEATVRDVSGLHSKIDRKRTVEEQNKAGWQNISTEITSSTQMIDSSLADFATSQTGFSNAITERMTQFVVKEMKLFTDGHQYLDQQLASLSKQHGKYAEDLETSKTGMNHVFGEIKELRQQVKISLGSGLEKLNIAAARIADEIASKMGEFQQDVHDSYSQLGSNFKQIFDGTQKHIVSQTSEIKKLKEELNIAHETEGEAIKSALKLYLAEQAQNMQACQAEEDNMLLQLQVMASEVSKSRHARFEATCNEIDRRLNSVVNQITDHSQKTNTSIDLWTNTEEVFCRKLATGKEEIKRAIVSSAKMANERTQSMQESTKTIHAETVQLVDTALHNVDDQTRALEEFVTRAQALHSKHSITQSQAVSALLQTASDSAASVQLEFKNAKSEIGECSKSILATCDSIIQDRKAFGEQLGSSLQTIRKTAGTPLLDDLPTRTTPRKQEYLYPSSWSLTAPLAMPTEPSIMRDMDANAIHEDSPITEEKISAIPAMKRGSLEKPIVTGQENTRPTKTRKRL